MTIMKYHENLTVITNNYHEQDIVTPCVYVRDSSTGNKRKYSQVHFQQYTGYSNGGTSHHQFVVLLHCILITITG